jgi:dihydroorotate dehydrogenase
MIARRAMDIFPIGRPALFLLDPERAHGMTIRALKLWPKKTAATTSPRLASSVAGIEFPTPLGLAAGFDKNADVPVAMLALGFGFVEVGTLTPKPQSGNPKPRLFRLSEDGGVINRMGFNNDGQADAKTRLAKLPQEQGIIGVNIGANKDAVDRIADYVAGVHAMAPFANYLTVNISSPNTPGLRGLQDKAALTDLLTAVKAANAPAGPPIFLKLAPDLTHAEIDDIVNVAAGKVDALIIGNTTISRPPLTSRDAGESGGLSGKPLAPLARQSLAAFRKASGGTIPLIAAGGIDSGAEAYARIRAGASLVQIYSALVYHGPGLARRMTRELEALLIRDGYTNVSEAVGADADSA